MGKGRVLTFEERKVIEFLSKDRSVSCRQIGERIGRKGTCVVNEFSRNGGRNAYTAEKGQQRANEQQKIKRIKLIEKLAKNNPVFPFEDKCNICEERIQNLEMQIEILCETIKSMRESI